MDCMEGIREFPDKHFNLAVCDPPYFAESNLHYHAGNEFSTTKIRRNRYRKSEAWDVPDSSWYEELLRVSKEQIVFGINYFSFTGVPPGRIVWDKQRAGLINSFSDGEIASCSLIKGVRFFRYRWDGMLQGDMKNKEYKLHVTQKPAALYRWIFANYAKPGDKIIDTHAGSASSLVAAHDAGLEFIGFELDPEYHRMAQERMDAHTAQTSLFAGRTEA